MVKILLSINIKKWEMSSVIAKTTVLNELRRSHDNILKIVLSNSRLPSLAGLKTATTL